MTERPRNAVGERCFSSIHQANTSHFTRVYPIFIIFTSYPVTLLNSRVNFVLTMNTSILQNNPPRKTVAESLVTFNSRFVVSVLNLSFTCYTYTVAQARDLAQTTSLKVCLTQCTTKGPSQDLFRRRCVTSLAVLGSRLHDLQKQARCSQPTTKQDIGVSCMRNPPSR